MTFNGLRTSAIPLYAELSILKFFDLVNPLSAGCGVYSKPQVGEIEK